MFLSADDRMRLMAHPISPLARWPHEIMTERLKLRAFRDSDVNWLLRTAKDPDILQMTGIPMDSTPASVRAFMKKCSPDSPENDETAYFIERQDDCTAVGVVAAHFRWKPGWEMGYWLTREQRGHGFATEAATALTDTAFTRMKIPAFFIKCRTHNDASAQVIQKLGGIEQEQRITAVGRIDRRLPSRQFLVTPESFVARETKQKITEKDSS